MTKHILYVLACLVLPVVWGVIVHKLFRRIGRAGKSLGRSVPPPDPPPIEYEI